MDGTQQLNLLEVDNNMIIKYLKYLGVIVGAIGLSIIGFIAYLLFCSWLDKRKLEYHLLEDIPSFCVLDVNTLREVTGNRDFPDFEAKQLWFYKSDSSHSVPHIECRFKKKMSEEDFEKFFQVESNIYWNPDKDGTLWFSRGWYKKSIWIFPKEWKRICSFQLIGFHVQALFCHL